MALQMIVALAVIIASGDAQKVGLKSKLGFGCFNSALEYNFSCPAVYLPYNCRCRNNNFLTTALNCINVYADDISQVAKGYDHVRSQCHYWGDRSLSIRDLDNIYKDNVGNIIDANSLNSTETVAPGPMSVPETLFYSQFRAAIITKYQYELGTWFGLGLIGYWIFVMLMAAIANALRIVSPKLWDQVGITSNSIAWIRQNVTLPALYGKKHNDPWNILNWLTIHAPTRGQALIILGFSGLNIASVVSFVGVDRDAPLSFAGIWDAVVHHVATRSGILAFMHIPVLVLFACRNNPLIPVTSWSFDTFMTFHRWVARWMIIHAVIHGVMIYWSSAKEDVIIYKWEYVHNWRAGNLALYTCFIMLIFALRTVRRHIYETFKATHQLMFLTFLICLIVHCGDYGWLGWLWASVVIYGVEYSLRFARVIASGGIQTAELTLTDAGMYRVRVRGRRTWLMHPGAYVYIRFLDSKLWWQSHPFSTFQSRRSRSGEYSLDLVCKVLGGSTAIISQLLLQSPNRTRNFRVLIEGPYGSANYVYDYDSVLLMAGGVGFTAMYSFASTILESMKPGQSLSLVWVVAQPNIVETFQEEVEHLMSMRYIANFHVYITKPETMQIGSLSFKSNEFSSSDSGGGGGQITQEEGDHITTPENIGIDGEHVGNLAASSNTTLVTPPLRSNTDPRRLTSDDSRIKRTNTTIEEDTHRYDLIEQYPDNIHYGRPDVQVLVPDFAKMTEGRRAVCSCGPPKFVDGTRASIVQSIMDTKVHIEYFEESFTW